MGTRERRKEKYRVTIGVDMQSNSGIEARGQMVRVQNSV